MEKKIKSKPKEAKEKIKREHSLTQEEVNSLEQRIKKEESPKEPEIKVLLNEQNVERISPSLKKINAPQKNPVRLESSFGDIQITNNNSKEEEENGLKYIPTGGRSGTPNYTKYEGMMIENMVSQKEIQKTSTARQVEKREIMFESSPQAKISAQENFERYTPVKRIDRDKLVREKQSERREIKYTPGKY